MRSGNEISRSTPEDTALKVFFASQNDPFNWEPSVQTQALLVTLLIQSTIHASNNCENQLR